MRQWLCTGLALLLAACATPVPNARSATEAPSWPSLQRFTNEREFLDYVRATNEARAARSAQGRRGQSPGKQSVASEELCPTPEDCPLEDNSEIMVTASARAAVSAASANTAITNVQTAGVDEGDIVKMIGPYLIVLQDGRLFSIDTGDSSADLTFTDRINVYRKDHADSWYDEILVHENRILATSYSYEHNATEFSVFSLSPQGRFTREGSYFISSNDYYDGDNYATRLVDGALVIYTPLALGDVDDDQPRWPLVRRWLREGEDGEELTNGRPLFDARDIYRPIQSTLQPTIHTISVCPLGTPNAGDELECRSTAIVGPAPREFYVSNDHVYLWTWAGYNYRDWRENERLCAARAADSFESATPAALFQINLETGRPRAMFIRGRPNDQLGMEATADAFHALDVWVDPRCRVNAPELPLRYFSTPLSAFSVTPQAAPESAFTPLPGAGGYGLENRFTAGHLVYGGRTRWSSYRDDSEQVSTGIVVAAPTGNPSAATVLQAPHNIIRVESIGEDAVLTGYQTSEALSMSVLDLSGAPRITDTARLRGRFETEGRSHAFNFTLAEDGSGVLGIPTGEAQKRSGRWVWDSESSDVSFVALSNEGRLTTLGELTSNEDAIDPTYSCEVSCIDWYGNSRPIFVGPRVFALSGTELVEGRVVGQSIREIARVNFTVPPPRH